MTLTNDELSTLVELWCNIEDGATAVVTLGIAGERASQHRLSGFNGLLQAAVEQETSNAQTEAANANIRTVRIEVDCAPKDSKKPRRSREAGAVCTPGSIQNPPKVRSDTGTSVARTEAQSMARP